MFDMWVPGVKPNAARENYKPLVGTDFSRLKAAPMFGMHIPGQAGPSGPKTLSRTTVPAFHFNQKMKTEPADKPKNYKAKAQPIAANTDPKAPTEELIFFNPTEAGAVIDTSTAKATGSLIHGGGSSAKPEPEMSNEEVLAAATEYLRVSRHSLHKFTSL